MPIPARFQALALTLFALLATRASAEPGVIHDSKGCAFVNSFPKQDEQITWTGACRDGWGDGSGTLQWIRDDSPGTRYVGPLTAGRPDGDGIMIWKNGDRYQGRFLAGRPAGPGVYTTITGLRFEDRFEQQDMSGNGTVSIGGGTRLEGNFRQGVLVDDGILVRLGPSGEQRLPVDVGERALPGVPAIAASAPDAPRRIFERRCGLPYPPVAIRQHATGKTRITLLVDTDGSVRRMRVLQPSGSDLAHHVLDVTAMVMALACPIDPGTIDGRPVPRWMPLEFDWRLE